MNIHQSNKLYLNQQNRMDLLLNRSNIRGENMRTTCLINNYNYANFLPEAINSVLNLTRLSLLMMHLRIIQRK